MLALSNVVANHFDDKLKLSEKIYYGLFDHLKKKSLEWRFDVVNAGRGAWPNPIIHYETWIYGCARSYLSRNAIDGSKVRGELESDRKTVLFGKRPSPEEFEPTIPWKSYDEFEDICYLDAAVRDVHRINRDETRGFCLLKQRHELFNFSYEEKIKYYRRAFDRISESTHGYNNFDGWHYRSSWAY